MTQEIMALCRAMGAREDQEELLLPLARAVADQLAGRLKAGITPKDCGPSFPLAAAMTVTDRLSRMTGGVGGGVTSFTAGDLTIRRETGNSGGDRSLSAQAEELLSPWLEDGRFLFRGIDG